MSLRPVLRGLRLRCPACGVGRMSPRWWSFARLADACPACGVRFEPARGEWSGSLMFAQGFYIALALLGLYALLLARAPLPALVAWGVATTVLLPVLKYRNHKGAWVGTMWAADPWRP